MKTNKFLVLFVSIMLCGLIAKSQSATGISVHDPCIIRQDSTFYIFCTGFGISVFSSTDMKNWKSEKPIFSTPPQWAVKGIPGFRGHIWAPDISYHNGQYYLYYAASAFGKNTSAIGVATNKTLNPADKNFKWIDHGKVIQSVPGRDMWNAIDPNLIVADNTPWLAFESFWEGIKLVQLDSNLLKISKPEKWYSLAGRKRNFIYPDSVAGNAQKTPDTNISFHN